MTQLTQFAYVQTRLQARHGLRPTEYTWNHLASQNELASYLQSARRSALRPWVLSLHVNDNYHTMEALLIHQYRLYIQEIAFWLTSPWREIVLWIKRLPDLPALQHLLMGNTAALWMLNDPQLKPFTNSNMEQRIEALRQSDCGPLVDGWQNGSSLVDAWLVHWHSLLSEQKPKFTHSINSLVQLLKTHVENFHHLNVSQTWNARTDLTNKLTFLFRRHPFEPVAAIVHLALVALDLERLRADIMQRAVFGSIKTDVKESA